MKKIYLLFVFSILALVVTATNKTWEFSSNSIVQQDNSSIPLASPYDFNGLILSPDFRVRNTEKNDPRTGAEGLGKLTHYLCLYGFTTPPVEPTIPSTDYCAFNVDGNAEIRILAVCSGTKPQTAKCVNSLGIQVGTFTTTLFATETDTVQVLSIYYTGAATTMTIYNSSASLTDIMRIYAIEVRPYTPTLIVDKKAAVSLLKAANQIINIAAETVEIYTILGAKVLGSSETAIDISGLASGVYIAKTATGSMKFVK